MDQQQLNQIDPKLREAYERVMGLTSANQPAAVSVNPQSSTINQNQPPATTVTPNVNETTPPPANIAVNTAQTPFVQQVPVVNPATINQTLPSADSSNPAVIATPPVSTQPDSQSSPHRQPPTPLFDPGLDNNQMHAYMAQEIAGAKQSIKTIQLIYMVGGLVFFLVYALFWMKFFNVSSPF